ncbi:MAG: HEPN domain-containing protein [Chloroflexi bacterium]|nr:HEPN domain-containing protein [Chloroflexota bacterium]
MTRRALTAEARPLAAQIRDAVDEVEPGAQVVLFGSRARGDAQPDSDWDVLVLVDGAVTADREALLRRRLFALELATGAVPAPVIVSRQDWTGARYRALPLYRNIDRDGIDLRTGLPATSPAAPAERPLEGEETMTVERRRIVAFRLERAREALVEAEQTAAIGHWNSAVSRLYYACFYAVSAVLADGGVDLSKHTAVRAYFNRELVRPGALPADLGALYNTLFDRHNDADYQDFVRFAEADVRPWLSDTRRFLTAVESLLTPPSADASQPGADAPAE